MKADLITALIGRDSARAAAEIDEMARICAAAQADIRLVTGPGGRLSLAAEAAAAQQLLASAGIEVSAEVPTRSCRPGPMTCWRRYRGRRSPTSCATARLLPA